MRNLLALTTVVALTRITVMIEPLAEIASAALA